MQIDIIWLGLLAGTITSSGFLPQIVRGYRTKKLDDVSYWMPLVLAIGMSLWLAYGLIINDFAIIATNIFGVACNVSLIGMKKRYD